MAYMNYIPHYEFGVRAGFWGYFGGNYKCVFGVEKGGRGGVSLNTHFGGFRGFLDILIPP